MICLMLLYSASMIALWLPIKSHVVCLRPVRIIEASIRKKPQPCNYLVDGRYVKVILMQEFSWCGYVALGFRGVCYAWVG